MVTFLLTQYTVAISLEMRIQTKSHSCALPHHMLAVQVSATILCGCAVLELQEENWQETDKK
jgi:hypothetical protein